VKIDFSYNLKKIWNKLDLLTLLNNRMFDNLYVFNRNRREIKSVLLYFPNYEMMHLGDHLFFEPLARFLKLRGYDVTIAPISSMEFYFRDLGFKISDPSGSDEVDLIISKVEFFRSLEKLESQFILFDTASAKILAPLCNDLIDKVSRFLGLEVKSYDPIPSYVQVLKGVNLTVLDGNDQYIIFNNYIDSGSIRSGLGHQEIITNFVIELKRTTGFKVIHTGSLNDLNRDRKIYGFVDIDLRGKTSVGDLFALCASSRVIYNVSFDGFQMHLFFIRNKKSFILFRGRFLKRNEIYIKSYVNPPFRHSDSRSLIEYIG